MNKSLAQRLWTVYVKTAPVGLSIVLTFTIQYTFFPGVMLVKKLDFMSSFPWFANFIITLHNLCDTIGRTLAGKWVLVSKQAYPYVCLVR